MSDQRSTQHDVTQQTLYEIRIKGHLGPQWKHWFDGLTITLEDDGNTLLRGTVADQSALHGILRRIRDTGMPLLSVNSTAAEPDTDQAKSDL